MDYLHRHPKSGRLSYRRAFPADLRRHIPNQPVELKRSLGASSINQPGAMERFQAAAKEYDAVVTKARKASVGTFDRLDEPTIAYLEKRFERALHEGAEQALKAGKRQSNLDGWEWLTDEFREWRREQDFEAVVAHWGGSARWLLDAHGYLLDPKDAEGLQKLCMALNDAALGASADAKARLNGHVIPLPAEPEAPALPRLVAQSDSATVEQLIKDYRALRDASVSGSTHAAYDASFRLLMGVVGPDRPVATLNRADGLALFEAVRSLPKNLGKVKALRGLPILEAIQKGKELGLPTISPKTVNDSYVANLRSLFKWAVKNDWMIKSPLPFEAAAVDRVAPEEKRDPFTDEQLQSIFGAALWVGEGLRTEKPIYRWGPLIALFMGLRRGEIAQLRVKDFSKLGGIPVVAVAADAGIDGRSFKNANARRRLAVHPQLIQLGLLHYVDQQRQNGQELWPGERPDARGRWGDGLSDWFTRLLSKREIAGRRLGMHSFRHNFEDALREADLHETGLGSYIAGRRPGDRVAAGYGKAREGYSARKLADAMRDIKYPGLDLSAVRLWEEPKGAGA